MNHRMITAALGAVGIVCAFSVVVLHGAPGRRPDATPHRPASAAHERTPDPVPRPVPATPPSSAPLADAVAHRSPESRPDDDDAPTPPPTYEEERAAQLANPLRPARTR